MFNKKQGSDPLETPSAPVAPGPEAAREEVPTAKREGVMNNPTQRSSADTVLSEGSRFEGNADVRGTLRIEGNVDGELNATDTVVVGKTGEAQATVRAGRAILNGSFKGKIEAADRVEMQAGSHVEADVTAANMVMEDGVHFRGNCKVGK